MKGNYVGTKIFVEITNASEKNHEVVLGIPVYITLDNEQIEPRNTYQGYFTSGIVYAGCTVESCYIFDSDQLSKVRVGDKLIMELSYSDKTIKKVINIEHKVPSKNANSACFIATAAYGTPVSQEIKVLRYWRVMELKNSRIGNSFVSFYYHVSPPIANFIRNKPLFRKCVRMILNPFVNFLKRKYKR